MNWLHEYLSPTLTSALGTTFLHSIWQGLLVCVFVFISFNLIKNRKSTSRFYVALAAILLFFITVCGTFVVSYQEAVAIHKLSLLSSTTEIQDNGIFPMVDVINITTNESLWYSAWQYLSQHDYVIVMFWLLGVFILSGRFVGGLFYIQKIRNGGLVTPSNEWLSKIDKWSQKLNLQRIPALYESSLVNAPLVFGYLKPMLLVPIGMLANMPVQHVEAILTHELMHLKNTDYLTNLFLSV